MTTYIPTKTQKRIDLLDVFRGFAVFGIFVVNIEIMNCVFINQDAFSQQWTGVWDKTAVRVLQLFFYSKFFPIFSFLFGLGISMQALKRLEKGSFSLSFFTRRMGVLFLFGIAHITLLWSGDVIHLYALLGLGIFVVLKWSEKKLFVLSIIVLLFPFYEQLAGFFFSWINYNPEAFLTEYTSGEITQTLREGSYIEGIQFRLTEYMSNIPVLFVFLAPIATAMFLLGVYFGKRSLVYNLEGWAQKMQTPMLTLALITNIYRISFLFLFPSFEWYATSGWRFIVFKLMFVSDVFMGLFYLWIIARLWGYAFWRKLLLPLRYVGRMALTHYILHSFVGLMLFSAIGFSLYERLSPVQTLLTACGVFVVQLAVSRLWLHYFNYGPLEWIWRCLSYGTWLPLKRQL